MKKQLLLLAMLLMSIMAWADDSGTCGDNVTYTYTEATKTLVISGTGSMNNYSDYNYTPWYSYRTNILTVNIENGVTSIGNYVFSGCSGLTSVTIPNSVISIGDHAFQNCSGLTSVTFPNSVTAIGERAFSNCSGLTSVTIGNSVTSIGECAFSNCSGLTSVHITDLASWCKIKFGGSESNPLYIAQHLYMNGEEIKNLVIPNSVTSIGNYAFGSCSVTSVTIPNSVISIGPHAFADCCGLTSVTIPNSVTFLGPYAFASCGLTSVTIPNSVTAIENNAFASCSDLTSITIPNSVTSIGNYAFGSCSVTSVTIPNSVTSIGDGAFYDCGMLTSVTIPNSVTSIGESAFEWCSSLATLTLPEDIKIIKKRTFCECAIKSITIPAKVEYIYQEAFNCNGTQEVKVLAEKPPFAYDNTFSNYNIPLYVPTGFTDAYQSTNPWSKFSSLKTLSGEDVEVKICVKPTIRYKNGKLTFNSETEGVNYQYTITDSDIKTGSGTEVQLSVTYNISVYAVKSGYQNSDVATATLCWIDKEPTTEGITDGVAQIPSKAVLIQSEGGILKVEGIDDGTQVSVYTPDGKQAGSAVCRNGAALVGTSILPGNTAIVKIGEKTVKVIIR